jgi:hypothetical protein
MEFIIKTMVTENNQFILEIDGFKIPDSDLGNVTNELRRVAKSPDLSEEEKEHEKKEILKQYAIDDIATQQ